MRIGILGSGVVGQQLGIGLIRSGHEVMIGTRSPDKLSDWQKSSGDNASVGNFEDAAKFGDIIFLATLWTGTESALRMAGKDNFINKIVVDVTNPLDFSKGTPPGLLSSPGHSAGEQVQRWLPDSRVVKAFNTISAYIMINPKRGEGLPDLFIAGDDEAKKFVHDLAISWGWGSVVDLGDISQSYILEAFAMLWIIYGFNNGSWEHAFKILRK